MSSLNQTLPGTWRLLSRVDRTPKGERRIEPALGEDPVALLYYDRAGNFAAQFMKRDRSGLLVEATTPSPNNSRALGGYDAYFGTYSVNETDGTVTQKLAGALSPENIGQVVTRRLTIEGDQLTIRLETSTAQGEPVVRTLIWQRVG